MERSFSFKYMPLNGPLAGTPDNGYHRMFDNGVMENSAGLVLETRSQA